jgi:hypothetical protein
LALHDDPGAWGKLAMMKPQRSGPIKLTTPQYRELHRIADATHGHAEGKGAEWAVRARLRDAGLLEFRRISEACLGNHVTQLETNMWFITDAGRALLWSAG